MNDDQPVFLEISEQAARTTGRMRAIGARNHRVRRTRQAADGCLRHHQEHGLKILGHTIGKLQGLRPGLGRRRLGVDTGTGNRHLAAEGTEGKCCT
ncbi:hypothetical protein D3C71_1919430 [compost metagenome]